MKKVNSKILILISVVIISIVAIIGFKYIQYLDKIASIDIYYLNTNSLGIEPVTRRYDQTKSNDDILSDVYRLFMEEQQVSKSTLSTAKPENVQVQEYGIDNQGLMTVSFSPEYKELSNIEEINLRSAFVLTFTDLDFVKKIKFEIDGYPYTTANSQVVDYFDRTNVIVEPTIALDKLVKRDITLYYSKKYEDQKEFLVAETRNASAEEGVPVEEVIVNELIKGSADGYTNLMPTNVHIRQVKRENSICFIDLDDKFLKGNLSEWEQKLRVYSLVNSLTELPYIDKVQILINAKKTKGFDDIDISKPLKRNEYFIKEKLSE